MGAANLLWRNRDSPDRAQDSSREGSRYYKHYLPTFTITTAAPGDMNLLSQATLLDTPVTLDCKIFTVCLQ